MNLDNSSTAAKALVSARTMASSRVKSLVSRTRSRLPYSGADQGIARTTPPSTRTALPVVPEAAGEHRYATALATSSVVRKRRSSDDGRAVSKNLRFIRLR